MLVLGIREEASTVKVELSTCVRHIATSSARGHNLVLPTFTLFTMYSMEKWEAWLNGCWNHIFNEITGRDIESCTCHQDEEME